MREIYIDSSAAEGEVGITPRMMRDLPLGAIEAMINTHRETVMNEIDLPGVDLSTLASYFTLVVLPENWAPGHAADWVQLSLAAQHPDAAKISVAPKVIPAKKRKTDLSVSDTDADFVLTNGPTAGLTSEFLQDVGRAYAAALARGERPNVAMAAQTGWPVKSVQRWVYMGRNSGVIPPAPKKGRAG